MESKASKLKMIALAIGILLLLVLLIAEWKLAFIHSDPRVDRSDYTDKRNIQVLVQPQLAPDFTHAIAEHQSGRSIPQWLFNHMLPYEMGAFFYEGTTSDNIDVSCYTSMPHLSKAANYILQSHDLSILDKNIRWNQKTATHPKAGLIVANGSVPPDTTTNEVFFYQWGDQRPLTTLSLSGDHFAELVFDNRAGQAYLSMASFMAAHGLDFGDDHKKLLASFQFVISIRAHIDITPDNTLQVYIGIEIQTENKNKIGVGTLHGGIKELFAEMGRRLEATHDITLSGGSEWNYNIVEFNYTFDDAAQVAILLAEGNLL